MKGWDPLESRTKTASSRLRRAPASGSGPRLHPVHDPFPFTVPSGGTESRGPAGWEPPLEGADVWGTRWESPIVVDPHLRRPLPPPPHPQPPLSGLTPSSSFPYFPDTFHPSDVLSLGFRVEIS